MHRPPLVESHLTKRRASSSTLDLFSTVGNSTANTAYRLVQVPHSVSLLLPRTHRVFCLPRPDVESVNFRLCCQHDPTPAQSRQYRISAADSLSPSLAPPTLPRTLRSYRHDCVLDLCHLVGFQSDPEEATIYMTVVLVRRGASLASGTKACISPRPSASKACLACSKSPVKRSLSFGFRSFVG